jgi:tRNA1(Val) A37 N6-methylase TrmN6
MSGAEPNPEADPWTDDPLTDRVRIWQRRNGHRYSLDDVLTAYEALAARPTPARYLDLGCGIGSVLLMVLDRTRDAELNAAAAIEAQDLSHAMARKNIERAGFAVKLVRGDLRQPSARAQLGGPFDLITGTPPYAPPGTATPSPDSQRAHARIEFRGGIESYMEAASELLAEDGDFVVCAAGAPERVLAAAQQARLCVHRQVNAIPRQGRPPLFHVWHLRRDAADPSSIDHAFVQSSFVARDASGERTDEYIALRAFFGLPMKEPTHG